MRENYIVNGGNRFLNGVNNHIRHKESGPSGDNKIPDSGTRRSYSWKDPDKRSSSRSAKRNAGSEESGRFQYFLHNDFRSVNFFEFCS